MKVLINERLSQHKMKTDEGYLICTDAVLARTGKQQYRKADIWADSDDPDAVIDIDRRPEDVFKDSTLASFENKPITIEHPDVDVNTENYHDYAVGFVRDVRKGKDGDMDVIIGDLVFTDQRAIDLIEAGEMTELSCGYNCDITTGDDPHQVNIRGNHVALCRQGRAGNARIVDTALEDAINTDVEAAWKKAGLKFDKTSYGYEFINRQHFDEARDIALKIAPGKYTTNPYINTIKFNDSIEDDIDYDETLEYYRENAFGYRDLRDYVNTDFGHLSKERREQIFKELKKRLYDSVNDARWELGNRVKYEGRWYWIVGYSRGAWLLEDCESGEHINVRDSVKDSKLLHVPENALIYEGDDEVDEQYLVRKYNVRFSHTDTFGYDIAGNQADIKRLYEDFNLEDYGVKIKDSVDVDDIEIVDPKDVDTDNYVIGKNNVWFAKARNESSMLTKAYASYDRGQTWHTCYLEQKSDAHDGKTQVGKYIFRTSRTFNGPRTSIGRNVLTWYANNGQHRVDERYEIDHVDGNFKNDNISNLERVDHAENIRRMQAMRIKHDATDYIEPKVEIKNNKGHFEGYINGKLICTGDNQKEVEEDLDEYMFDHLMIDSINDVYTEAQLEKAKANQIKLLKEAGQTKEAKEVEAMSLSEFERAMLDQLGRDDFEDLMKDSVKDSLMIPAGSELELFHTVPYGSKIEIIPGTFKYKLRKDYAADDMKQLREAVFNEAATAFEKKYGKIKGGNIRMDMSWRKLVVKRSDDSLVKPSSELIQQVTKMLKASGFKVEFRGYTPSNRAEFKIVSEKSGFLPQLDAIQVKKYGDLLDDIEAFCRKKGSAATYNIGIYDGHVSGYFHVDEVYVKDSFIEDAEYVTVKNPYNERSSSYKVSDYCVIKFPFYAFAKPARHSEYGYFPCKIEGYYRNGRVYKETLVTPISNIYEGIEMFSCLTQSERAQDFDHYVGKQFSCYAKDVKNIQQYFKRATRVDLENWFKQSGYEVLDSVKDGMYDPGEAYYYAHTGDRVKIDGKLYEIDWRENKIGYGSVIDLLELPSRKPTTISKADFIKKAQLVQDSKDSSNVEDSISSEIVRTLRQTYNLEIKTEVGLNPRKTGKELVITCTNEAWNKHSTAEKLKIMKYLYALDKRYDEVHVYGEDKYLLTGDHHIYRKPTVWIKYSTVDAKDTALADSVASEIVSTLRKNYGVNVITKVEKVNKVHIDIPEKEFNNLELEQREQITKYLRRLEKIYPNLQFIESSRFANHDVKFISKDSVVTRISSGEKFKILKVPGDGFVYMTSLFDSRTIKAYEDDFNKKYKMKDNKVKDWLPSYDDDVASDIDDILEAMHIDYDGDIQSGIAIPKSKVSEFERRLRQKNIDYEEYDEDRSSSSYQGINFFR